MAKKEVRPQAAAAGEPTARDRSEQSPGRAGTGSRDRKVARRQEPARHEDAQPIELDTYAQVGRPLRELLAEGPAGALPVESDLDRARAHARDGKGDVPFCGWFSNDEEE